MIFNSVVGIIIIINIIIIILVVVHKIIILLIWEFFKSVSDGFPLEFERQQVSSSLQDSS